MQKFIGRDFVNPGETITAEITILATPYFKGRLYERLEFIVTEGSKITADGIIIEILDVDLRRNSQ